MKLLGILLVAFSANAAKLSVVNNTGSDIRILELHNRCDGYIVSEDKPIFFKNKEKRVIGNVTPVVQVYTICGSGLCTMSAIGMRDAKEYTIEVVLQDGIVSGMGIPDHWVGNIECPK